MCVVQHLLRDIAYDPTVRGTMPAHHEQVRSLLFRIVGDHLGRMSHADRHMQHRFDLRCHAAGVARHTFAGVRGALARKAGCELRGRRTVA